MPKRESRVFVTQQPKPNHRGWTPNLSSATRYGALHFVFSSSERISSEPDTSLMIASEALEDFDPTTDYILWPNGVDPFSIWAVLIVLMMKGVHQVRGLNWERRINNGQRDYTDGYYTPVLFRSFDRLINN